MKKYVIRANEPVFFASFERSAVSALLGPRRVGKTTLMHYYMKLHPERKWVSLNMDSMQQRKRIMNEELHLLIEQEALKKIGDGTKIWVFIDEAQKCPALFDQVKLLYDTYKETDALKFILTGSAHLNLHMLAAESLAGRVELLTLREFTMREMASLLHPHLVLPADSVLTSLFASIQYTQIEEIYDRLLPFQKVLQEVLKNHLIWGGLPEVYQEQSTSAHLRYLGNYLQTYLEKDIRALDTVSDLQLFENIMKISAEHTGSLRDDKKILDALHCSRNTLAKYRSFLLATLQYFEIYPYIESSVKRLVKSPKGYLINNGLVSYLTGMHDASILEITGLIGHRLENWFLNEIQTWMDASAYRHEITFWRTPTDTEVDFVVSLGRCVIPFEITISAQPHSSHVMKKVHNLKSFMQKVPQATLGCICYSGPLSYDASNRILFLPTWLL